MPKKADEKETGLVVRESKTQTLTRPGTFSPTTFAEAMTFSEYVANSDLAPKDFKGKPANVLIALQMGAELGLPPMAALQNIAVINGRPSLWGDSALAVVMNHPDYEWHKEYYEGAGKELTAVFEIKRRRQEVHVSRFTMADALLAGLTGKEGPWRTYPGRMLKMRARGYGLRDKFADALRGLQIAEEAQDMPPIPGETGAVSQETVAKKREREVATLEPSKEVNRGHGDEGLSQTAEAAKPADPAVAEPTAAVPETVEQKQEKATDLTTIAGVVTKIEPKMTTITAAQKAKAKKDGKPEPNPRPYFNVIVQCTEEGQTLDVPVLVWHQSMHAHVPRMFNKPVDLVIARSVKNEGTDRETVFYSLEVINKIGDVPFIDNEPSLSPAGLFTE